MLEKSDRPKIEILEIKDGIVVNIEQNTLNQSFTNNLIGKRNTEIYQIIDNYKR